MAKNKSHQESAGVIRDLGNGVASSFDMHAFAPRHERATPPSLLQSAPITRSGDACLQHIDNWPASKRRGRPDVRLRADPTDWPTERDARRLVKQPQ